MIGLLKTVASLCLVFSLLVGFTPATTHAIESQTPSPVDITQKAVTNLNLDSLDLSKPYSEAK